MMIDLATEKLMTISPPRRVTQRRGSASSSALWADSRGASLVEYVILVGLVAIVAYAGFQAFGEALDGSAASVATFVREKLTLKGD